MKSGELGDVELFGAGVRAEIQRGEGFADTVWFGESPEIIDQSFALLRETQFHKIQEVRCAVERKVCAFAGQAECDEGGGDFRPRVESVARDFKDEFWARVELRDDGEIAVIARAGLGGQAEGHFGLNDDVDFVDEAGEAEQVMKDRRRNVVGKISVDEDAAAASDRGEVGFEDVAGDDGKISRFFCGTTERFGDVFARRRRPAMRDGSSSMAWTGAPVARRGWVISPWPEPISIQQC